MFSISCGGYIFSFLCLLHTSQTKQCVNDETYLLVSTWQCYRNRESGLPSVQQLNLQLSKCSGLFFYTAVRHTYVDLSIQQIYKNICYAFIYTISNTFAILFATHISTHKQTKHTHTYTVDDTMILKTPLPFPSFPVHQLLMGHTQEIMASIHWDYPKSQISTPCKNRRYVTPVLQCQPPSGGQ